MAPKRVLLGIFAHPDDESFGPGATLARYAAEGADVHVVIATDGIAGSVEDPAHVAGHETLAQVRSAELSRAAVALGVTVVWSLPYRDSGMRGTPANDHPDALIQQPLAHTVAEVLEYIERLRPQVIMTHDPYGGYGHPDHIRCCEATTTAFFMVRDRAARGEYGGWPGPQKLYYTAFPKQLMKLFVRVMPLLGKDPTAIGRNRDINLVEISQWETPVHSQDLCRRVPGRKTACQPGPCQPVQRRPFVGGVFACRDSQTCDGLRSLHACLSGAKRKAGN